MVLLAGGARLEAESVPLRSVSRLGVRQGPLQRVLGYGTLLVGDGRSRRGVRVRPAPRRGVARDRERSDRPVIADLASAGRRRGLAQLAGPRGVVALGLLGGAPPTVRRAALDALGPHLTGVCLAPADAADAAAGGRLPGRTGLAADLTEAPREPLAVRLDTSFSPGAARRIGASAALLRVPIRPDIPAQAERAVRIAALAALACHEEGLPLVLRIVIPRGPASRPGTRGRASPPRPHAWRVTRAPIC